MDAKGLSTALAAVAAIEPDIAIAVSAYNAFRAIWTVMNPGKTEDDFRSYLRTTSDTNVNTTAVLLKAAGLIETPPGSGNWSDPLASTR